MDWHITSTWQLPVLHLRAHAVNHQQWVVSNAEAGEKWDNLLHNPELICRRLRLIAP